MAKTRTYCIASNAYESRVIAHLVGPARPALSTLLKAFRDDYGMTNHGPYGDAVGISTDVTNDMNAFERLRAEGYDGLGTDEQFVSWLKRHHGFTDADVTMQYV